MEKIKLKVYREPATVASIMPYDLFLDNIKIDSIYAGSPREYILEDNKPLTLNVKVGGSSFTTRKLDSFVILDPSKCTKGGIAVTIKTNPNNLGFFSGGLLAPMGNLDFVVDYNYDPMNPGLQHGHSNQPVAQDGRGTQPPSQQPQQPQQPQPPIEQPSPAHSATPASPAQPGPSAAKFCYACGEPLPSGAKFCPQCGKKMM